MVFKFHFHVQQRYVLTAIVFLLLALAYAFRISFPLILTQMVYVPNSNTGINNYTRDASNDTENELICPIKYSMAPNGASELITNNHERYQWSQKLQGTILSSYFWGSILTQIPGGILAQKYGGKMILLTSIILSAVLFAITPLAVSYGDAIGLISTRSLIGFLQGPLIPSVASIITAWIPIEERARCCAVAYMGINVGNFVSTYIVGLVLYHIGRWDVIFYGFAVLSLITAIVIAFFCYDLPQNHPLISEKEKDLLKLKTAEYLEAEKKNLPPTPWMAIFTSIPVFTLIFSLSLATVSTYILSTGISKYLNDVLHIPIERNSIYLTIPHIVSMFVSIFAGFLSDWMLVKCRISLTNVRKTFVVLSTIPSAIFSLAASYGECEEKFVATMFSLAISTGGFGAAGLALVPFDLSPNYSGPFNAVVHTCYSIAALIAPFIVGIITPHAFLSEWRFIWWFAFIAFVSSTAIFLVWGSAKIQPWNSVKKPNQNVFVLSEQRKS